VNTNRVGAEASLKHYLGKSENVHPLWPTSWIEHMVGDGSRQAFGSYVRVTQTVSQKTFVKDGNTHYYVDVTNIEVVK
jgi:hypothetical protein